MEATLQSNKYYKASKLPGKANVYIQIIISPGS